MLCGTHASSDDKHILSVFYDKIQLQLWKFCIFYSKDVMRHASA